MARRILLGQLDGGAPQLLTRCAPAPALKSPLSPRALSNRLELRMIGKISAIAAAALCALLLVAIISGFAPPVAAHAAQTAEQMDARTAGTAAPVGRPACVEVWPYYEPACLHDARQPGGRARVVRVVSIERTALESLTSRSR